MNDASLRDAFGQLAHIYAGAAAAVRDDRMAIAYLRGQENNRRQLLQGSLQVTAQAIRYLDGGFDRSLLMSLSSDAAREDLYDGALAHVEGDRLTVLETIERLTRVKRSVTDIGAPLIAELWGLASFMRGQRAEAFAERICVAAGLVGSALED